MTIVPDEGGPHLFLNKTEMETGYYGMYITAYDPNASNVWIVLDGDTKQGRPGNSLTWVDGFDKPGEHKVKAIFMDTNGNKWDSMPLYTNYNDL